MIKTISNVSIDSALLKISGEEEERSITRTVSLNITADATTTQRNYDNLNMRIIAATGDACKTLDFIAQRYNEFFRNNIDNRIDSYQYNDFIHSSLRTNKMYLKAASPFSPFSANKEESQVIFRNGKFASSDTDPVPPNVVIGDFPVMDILDKRKNKKLSFRQISFELPQQDQDLTSLSLYAFIYGVAETIPGSRQSENIFSINVSSTEVAIESVLGLGYYYKEATSENPFVGMSGFTTIDAPAASKLSTIDQRTDIDPRSLVREMLNKFREDDVISDESYSDQSYYSDLWSSRDDKDRYRIACAFDMKSFLINNSVFPSMYKSERLCKILLGDSREGSIVAPQEPSHLQSSTLSRRQIDQTALAPDNLLGTGARSIVRGPSSTFSGKDVGSLSEVTGLSDAYGGIKFLESSTADTLEAGTFQYGVKLLVTDSSLETMRRFASLFVEIEHSMGRILRNVGRSLRTSDVESILSNLSGLDFLLGIMASRDDIGLKNHYASRIYAGDARSQMDTLREINNIFSLIVVDILDRLRKVSPGNPLGDVSNTGTKAMKMGQNRTSRSLIQESEYYFPKVVSSDKNYRYGADYVINKNTSSTGIETVTIEQFLQRRNEEFAKYFQPIVGNNSEPPENGYFADASYSYMTPRVIRTPEREIINQPSVNSERYAVSYNFDRYAQLFADIVSINLQTKNLDSNPVLAKEVDEKKDNQSIFNSAIDLLSVNYGVTVKDVAKPQFKAPKVVTGVVRDTIIDPLDTEECSNTTTDRLIPSIIGGNDSIQTTTKSLLNSINSKVLDQDKTQLKGYTFTNGRSARIGSIKIPFAILGELTLSPEIQADDSGYNSLTRLKNFLNVAQDQVNDALQQPFVSLLPNQIKSMISFAATNERETLGVGTDNTQYSSTRPVLLDSDKSDNVEEMISYYGKNEDIPPYPKTLDPMKAYSRFLAFWMNYKQIGVVEYLDGFEDVLASEDMSEYSGTLRRLKLPIWRKLDASKGAELQNQSTKLLCRVRSMSSQDYVNLAGEQYSVEDRQEIAKIFETKEILNLPSYNQYFYLEGSTAQESPGVLE